MIGFFPPSNVGYGDSASYVIAMIVGTILLSAPPFVFALSKGHWWDRHPLAAPEAHKATSA